MSVYVIVPENETLFNKYYHLKSEADNSELSIGGDGAVITPKIADLFGVKMGDTLTIKDADNNTYSIKVAEVAENYTSNYIYMNKGLYEKVFREGVKYNSIISNHSTDEKILAKDLIDSGLVLTLLSWPHYWQLLFFTLKVLGFNDGETNGYVYQEALVLTIVSIAVGLVLGVFLHRFVLGVIEQDNMTLFRKINVSSYVLSVLITVAFSVIMQGITYMKLKTIDMIQSLKSVE